MEVMFFPYLPLDRRLQVGPWALIPREQLEAADCISAEMVDHAQGVAALYRLRGNDNGYGAFVHRVGASVGVEDTHEGFGTLGTAVGVALIDRNPSHAAGPNADPNAGHGMCTTENALAYGHRFTADRYTAFATGAMVVMQHGGAQVGVHEDIIDPPADLMLPVFRPRFDKAYASALYEVLEAPEADAPDLAGAIRWLMLAWSNSPSIDENGRILALRAGFDVLFDGAATSVVRERLASLLDGPAAVRAHRRWVDHGNQREGDLTDLEWWFQSFALLRNKIAHGGVIPQEDFIFDDDVRHLWHAEWNLRRAVKKTVANAGHDDVLLNPYERALQHHARLIAQDIAAEAEAEGGE